MLRIPTVYVGYVMVIFTTWCTAVQGRALLEDGFEVEERVPAKL